MSPTPSPADGVGGDPGTPPPPMGLGPALRRAWLGYQLRLDSAMAEAGFGERRFPDGRVLRLCSAPSGSTISAIGRELGMTRQGAGKVVESLRALDYLTVTDSAVSKREKSALLTARGAEYLRVQREAARSIETEVRAVLGGEGFSSLIALVEALDPGEEARLQPYLRRSTRAY